jgi:thimet oligopeptidase
MKMPIRMPIIITTSILASIVISCSAHTANKEIKPVIKSEKTIMIKEPPVWKQVDEVEKYCQEHLDRAQMFRKTLIESKNLPQKDIIDTFNDMLIELDRVLPLTSLNANVHPNENIRSAAEVCQQKAMQVMTGIELDRDLFESLSRVDQDSLTGETRRFVKLLMRNYKRAGVALDEETRKKISKIRAELVTVEQEFSRNIREDVRSLSFPAADLTGLPEDFLKAHQPNEKGEITITTKYPEFFPFQTYVKKAEPRKKLYQAFLSRAYPDNEKLLMKMLELRHKLATVLGYPNWAAYNAEDKMVRDTKTIQDFIDQVAAIGKAQMEKDLAAILDRKKQDHSDATQVHVWDRFYYVKKIQQEQYDVDPLEVRQYFNFPRSKRDCWRSPKNFSM